MIGQNILHYKILKKLGEGGMGVVYLAEDTKLERKVALKFLPPQFSEDPEINARFKREAKAAAALNHPNVITVYEVGEHEGMVYIAMEYVDGMALRHFIDREKLAIDKILELVIQICEGLQAAHQAGIVHRDIKPENIVIHKENRVKILDFGLARVENVTRLTKESSTLGTLYYMSPEQLQGMQVDQRTDIWSLGVVLYEMITQSLPFQGVYEGALMYSILNETPAAIASLRPDVPTRLSKIVNKALARDCEERYQEIGQLIVDLKSDDEELTGTATTKKPIKSKEVSTSRESASRETASRETASAERRRLTVMFCDMADSIALSGQLDPEALHSVLREFQTICTTVIQRFDGHVANFTGGGLLAYFGYPTAHDDDAQRAVRSGLEILDATKELVSSLHQPESDQSPEVQGFRQRVRVGIHTGLVVAGDMNEESQLASMAIVGETPHIAKLLQGVAEPDSVLISTATYRMIEGFFDCRDLGSQALQGLSQPLQVYQVIGIQPLRTRFQAVAARGLTPLVGRSNELMVLNGYLDQAKNGRGQVVFVSGEAGIGKSRLLLEFQRSIQGQEFAWLEGQCISYGQKIPYLPIVDLLKNTFGIEEDDNDTRIIQRIAEATASWEKSARETIPYLKFLLNVDPGVAAIATMDPIERRAGIFDGLRNLFIQESRGLMVVVVEDLHWIDEQSEAALAALVDIIASLPVLLLLSYRPGYIHSLGERTYFSRLALGNLPAEESTELMQSLLQVSALPGQIAELISAKAEGNPFHVEEVTKSLVETGVLQKSNGGYRLQGRIEDVSVPDTIQEVIQSRIDRLPPDPREALQLASVIGREFTQRLLARISNPESTTLDDALAELKVLGLIYQRSFLPELAYMFKHALTHDVAYATLLLEKRKVLHRIIGAAIEELYSDRLSEHYETVAHHYFKGGQWEKALEYLVKAGDKATAAYANQDALDYYGRALEVCGKLGDRGLAAAVNVSQQRGMVNFTMGDFTGAINDFDHMCESARRLGDRHLEGVALAYRGWFEWWNHDFEVAEATANLALAIAEEGFDDVRFFANSTIGLMFYGVNRKDEAQLFFRAAEKLAPKVDDLLIRSWWSLVGWHQRQWEGRFDETLAHLARWRSSMEDTGMVFLILGDRWLEAVTRGSNGDYQRALALLNEVQTTGDRVGGVPFWQARALNTFGWIYGELQDVQKAMEYNKQGIEAAQAANFPDPEVESNARLNLGDNLMALNRLDEAGEQYRIVEKVARNPRPQDRLDLWRYSQHLYHSYGELWLLRGKHKKALNYADKCLLLAEPGKSPKYIVKARRLRGQVFLGRGELTAAEREFEVALEVAQSLGNPPQLWKTYEAVGDLLLAQSNTAQARRAYNDALSVIEEVASSLKDKSLRKLFLNSEAVQKIRRAAAFQRGI